MSAEENVKVVKDGFAAYRRGDIAGLIALLANDVEWHLPGAGTPIAGTYRGHDGVATFFQKLAKEVDVLDFQPREFVGEGDRVFVAGWTREKVKATNRTFETDWVMAFTVRNGKVTNFREYLDTQAIASAYQSARAAG